MKTKLLILVALLVASHCSTAQTADTYVSQGLADLSAQDIIDANTSFESALSLSRTNENANALYAVTRLINLAYQPAGSNILTRIGIPIAGRNIYHWTALPPADTNGVPLAPSGVDTEDFVAQLRTNCYPAVAGAISNLSLVTDTNYSISLTSAQTDVSAVTVDYGDLKLIEAGLYGAEYLIFTLNSQNLNAQLTDLRALYTSGELTAGEVLGRYPSLFTFASTNDLAAAQIAFTNAVNTYLIASEFIRNRPANEVRLFNYDGGVTNEEADFRMTIQELEGSIFLGPQKLAVNPSVTVNASPLFNGATSIRSLLPGFSRNGLLLGTLPDATFGGTVFGLDADQVEGELGNVLKLVPVGGHPAMLADNMIALPFAVLPGRSYLLESSANLAEWQIEQGFTATNDTMILVDYTSNANKFYRLVDDSGVQTYAGIVLDEDTDLPIVGAEVLSYYDGTVAHTDANGRFFLITTLPTSYYGDYLGISATGYGTYEGYLLPNPDYSSPTYFYLTPNPYNDNFTNRFVLSGSDDSFSGDNTGATVEPNEPVDSPYGYLGGKSVWFTWTAPSTASYSISVSSSSMYEPILAIYTGSSLPALTKVSDVVGSAYYAGYYLAAVAGQAYQIEVDDNYGYGGPYTLTIQP